MAFALSVIAEPSLQSSIERVDADAWTHARAIPGVPEIGQTLRPPHRAELTDVTQLLRTMRVDTHPARHRHPGPDVFELAVGREHLPAIVMAGGAPDEA